MYEEKDGLMDEGKNREEKGLNKRDLLTTFHKQSNAQAIWARNLWKDYLPVLLLSKEINMGYYGVIWDILWVSCPSCVPSQPLVHPQATHWGSRTRNREDFDTIQQQLRYPCVNRYKIISIQSTAFSTSANSVVHFP